MIKAVIATGAACLLLMGCEDEGDRIRFEGELYRAKLKVDKEDRTFFTVTVAPVSRGAKGALEAGRFEATLYCVNTYGSSRIDWIDGPDQDPETVVVDKDTLTLQGACPD